MNGIVININPVALQIGGFQLHWYSIAVMMAILAAVVIAVYEGKRKGIPATDIYSLALCVVVAGIIGARLFHVVDHWEHYAANPAHIFHFQGLAIWGGLAGGGVAAIAFARIRRIPLGLLADTVVPALLAAQIIGRFGCIVNGDAYGGPTDLPWGFVYLNPGAMIPNNLFGIPTHPYPVYEMLLNLSILLLVLKLRRHYKTDGLLFFTYLGLYSAVRFALTFVRQENEFLWGLQQAQLIGLPLILASAAVFFYLYRKDSSRKLMSDAVAEAR